MCIASISFHYIRGLGHTAGLQNNGIPRGNLLLAVSYEG